MNIDVKEALRYMGCNENNPELKRLALQCIDELNEIMTPRFTYGVFDVSVFDNSVEIKDTKTVFESYDIANLLKNSHNCVIMAATLGIAVDKKIAMYQVTDMSKAIAFDACASSAIESVCETAIEQIKTKEIVKNLTIRFSPGYGDFDIRYQKEIINLIDGYKKIGLTATSSMVLTPKKSVTAIIGITDKPYMTTYSCSNCNLKDNCEYKKGCGNK